MKVKRQLFCIFAIAIFIPVMIIGIYLVYNTRSLLFQHYKNQCLSDNLRVKSLLLDMTSNIYNKSDSIASDPELIRLLSKKYTSEHQSLNALTNYDKITSVISQDPSIQTIHIYSLNPTITKTDYVTPINKEMKNTEWFQHFKQTSTPFWSSHKKTDSFGNSSMELCFYEKIFLPSIKSYAILNTTVSNNHLKNRIENSSLRTILWLEDRHFFYSSDNQMPTQSFHRYTDNLSTYYLGKVKLKDVDTLGCISYIRTTYSDDVFHIASIDDEGYFYIHKITTIHYLIILMILIASGTFISIYSRYFSKRVIALREAMHDASCGNYHITDSFSGEDEISEAFRDLNIMIQNILEKEMTAYETRIKTQKLINQQQQMEFKMLSSQINPHFLYNTLETIRMRALKAGNREVANAIKLLGKSMRYVLENTTISFTPLDREMNYIKTYLSIQKLRFHDRVNYSLKTSLIHDLSWYKIMPLLIQPIVENALLHGLEEVEEKGRIVIHIRQKEKLLIIDIFDNGCGMTPEEVEKMKQNIYDHPKNSSKSIGLANIYQRIQLYYGKKYGLSVKSKKNLGTVVTMTLPAQEYRREDN